MATGASRINGGWGNQHSVIVLYEGGKSFEIPEETYRAASYNPPFDTLPWQTQETK